MVLTELRKIYKVSMQELADSISVSKQLIGKIEKGNRDITEDVLSKLVDYFGLKCVTNDYKKFLLKDSMDEIEILKVKRAKLMISINEVEYEHTFIDDNGEEITAMHTHLDGGETEHLYYLQYQIHEKQLFKKISSFLSKCFNDQNPFNVQISNANEYLKEFDRLIEMYTNGKVEKSIFMDVIRAIEITYYGGIENSEFVNKIVDFIKSQSELFQQQ